MTQHHESPRSEEGSHDAFAAAPSRRSRLDSFDWENWDGQDSSVPDEPWVPDAVDLLLHPELAGRGGEDEDAEEEEEPGRPEHAAPPAPAPLAPPEPPPHVPAPEDSGFYYRNGNPIPPTHPDHGPMHLIPRQADGSFAAHYYCSKAELAALGSPPPPPRRDRRDGFSADRQQHFIKAYRDTGSLTDAARLTGISRSTAYNLINSADGGAFRDALAEAARGIDTLLEATAIERAIKGQEEIVYYQGQRVGVRWRYDNRLLMSLLRARKPLQYAPLSEIEGWLARRGVEPPADVDGALDRLAAAEAEWGRRLPGEGEAGAPAVAAAAPPAGGQPALAAKQHRPPGGDGSAAQSLEGGGSPAEPVQASSSSTLPGGPAAQASTSSTLPGGPAAQASTSSISPARNPAREVPERSSGADPQPG